MSLTKPHNRKQPPPVVNISGEVALRGEETLVQRIHMLLDGRLTRKDIMHEDPAMAYDRFLYFSRVKWLALSKNQAPPKQIESTPFAWRS